jgi:hypothetical protein
MNPKTKKVLTDQGSQVVQALKWIGGAIFGDADEVLDDMAAKGDANEPPRPRTPPKRVAVNPVPRRAPPPRRQDEDVIDVEGFVDEDDE